MQQKHSKCRGSSGEDKGALTKGILGNATKHYLASHTIHVPLQTIYKRLEYITTETAEHLDNGSKYIKISTNYNIISLRD
jgi:hypothetical protein